MSSSYAPRSKLNKEIAAVIWGAAGFFHQEQKLIEDIKRIQLEEATLAGTTLSKAIKSETDKSILEINPQKMLADLKTFEEKRTFLKEQLTQKKTMLQKMQQDEKQKINTARILMKQTIFKFCVKPCLEEARLFLEMKKCLRSDAKSIQSFFQKHPHLINETFSHEGAKEKGITPLMLCVLLCRDGAILSMLCNDFKADINAKSITNGYTALHWLVKYGHYQQLECLLTLNANPLLPDAKGQTPHDLLKQSGRSEAILNAMSRSLQNAEKIAASTNKKCIIS